MIRGLPNGSTAIPPPADTELAGKVDGIAGAIEIEGTLNSGRLVGQVRTGFVLLVAQPEEGRPVRVSHYASNLLAEVVGLLLHDQVEKIRRGIEPTSPQVPFFPLSASGLEAFKQLFRSGPTWDGDVVSKEGRRELVEAGLATHAHGWAFLTDLGIQLAVESGMADRKINGTLS